MSPAQTDNQLTQKSSVKTLRWFFVFVAVFVLILSGSLYYVLNSGARQALVKQMHLREESVSKAGAQSISSFIKLFGNSIVLLADNPEIISRGTKTQEVLNSFVEIWRETPINGILLVDKVGKTSLFSTKTGITTLAESTSVSDRDYFVWAKQAKKREVFIGEPIIPRVGNLGKQYIIPVATPIYKEGNFDGLLVSSILLTQLTKEYLEPLKMSEDTRVYLVSSNGTILYGPFESLIGKNYIQYLKDHPFLGSTVIASYLKQKAESTEPEKLDIVLPDEKKGGITRFLIAYAPIFYNHSHLLLAIAVPADEALTYIAPVYINQLGALIAGFLAILLLTIVFIKFRERRKRKD
jgi:hypothetical protein